MRVESQSAAGAPYFSICVPQYNRTDFLIEACRIYAAQTFRDFELCISDDCSTDGKSDQLIAFLKSSGLRFVYARVASNLRYDGNLRAAIGLSSGEYLLLMGNDDALNSPDALAGLRDDLEAAGDVSAAIANYHELSTGVTFRRMSETRLLGSGPDVAIAIFRSYSFVSGVILHGPRARAESTSDLDGSEMYQMYLGARLIARGGNFLAISRVCINKDLQIPGQDVDSYRARPRISPCPFVKRPLPMGRLLEVIAYALRPCVPKRDLDRLMFRVARDLYLYTYPFWGVEYRRIQSWRFATGILMALNPDEIGRKPGLSRFRRLLLWLPYLVTSAVSLALPIGLFDRLRPMFYSLAKRKG